VDHINNDKLDNRRENLHFATPSENSRNRTKKEGSTSKYYGVSFNNEGKKWICKFNNKESKIENFMFEKEDHAAYWYDVLMKEEFGLEYVKLNNIAKPDDFIVPTKRVKNTRSIYQVPSGKYQAKIGFNGELIYIGSYNTEEEAAKAYDEKKAELEFQFQQSQNNVIKRNTEGHAIIEVYNKGTLVECIVDDDIYFELNKFRWCFSEGYVQRSDTSVRIHRHIMNAKIGDERIDHINGNPLDNRKINLRFSNASLNNHNRKKSENTSSDYHGVSKSHVLTDGTQCYQAKIVKDGITYNLGTHRNELDAAKAYNKKAVELYGDYVRLNTIRES
jgi:hypothetical protein